MRELMSNYLWQNDVGINDETDVNTIMRNMMSVNLEASLEENFDKELVYTKYDYRYRDADFPKKPCIPAA